MRAQEIRFGPLAVTKPVPIPVLPTRHPDPIRPQPASLAPLLPGCPPPPGRRTSMTPGARRGDQPGQPRSEPDLLQRRDLAGQAAGRPEYQGLHTLPVSSWALLPPRERNRNTLLSGTLVHVAQSNSQLSPLISPSPMCAVSRNLTGSWRIPTERGPPATASTPPPPHGRCRGSGAGWSTVRESITSSNAARRSTPPSPCLSRTPRSTPGHRLFGAR